MVPRRVYKESAFRSGLKGKARERAYNRWYYLKNKERISGRKSELWKTDAEYRLRGKARRAKNAKCTTGRPRGRNGSPANPRFGWANGKLRIFYRVSSFAAYTRISESIIRNKMCNGEIDWYADNNGVKWIPESESKCLSMT